MIQQPKQFLCTIENEKIMQLDYAGRCVGELGVTTAQYNEALNVVQGYKDKLIEAGILKKEKTVQELQEEQNEMLRKLLTKVDILEGKYNELSVSNTNNKKHASKADTSVI